MSETKMPAWLSAIVEKAMRPQDDMGHDESWATPTHVIGADAVEANGDVCSDYASDLVGLLIDEITLLKFHEEDVAVELNEQRAEIDRLRALLREAVVGVDLERFKGWKVDTLQALGMTEADLVQAVHDEAARAEGGGQ